MQLDLIQERPNNRLGWNPAQSIPNIFQKKYSVWVNQKSSTCRELYFIRKSSQPEFFQALGQESLVNLASWPI